MPRNLSTDPLISCVMPTYGRPAYVDESVAMFLAQDYPHKELILLNDCVDQTYRFEHSEVHVVNRAERYPTLGEKRNATIEMSRGELIAVWDDDDVYLPWRLSFTLEQLRKHETPFYRAAEFWAYWGESTLHKNQSIPSWVNHPNTLFTKKLWQQVAGYPALNCGEDTGFFRRIHKLLDRPFIKYPLAEHERFFLLRGKSQYAHMSIHGGENPLNTSPGDYEITPAPIADPLLREACRSLIEKHESNKSSVKEIR